MAPCPSLAWSVTCVCSSVPASFQWGCCYVAQNQAVWSRDGRHLLMACDDNGTVHFVGRVQRSCLPNASMPFWCTCVCSQSQLRVVSAHSVHAAAVALRMSSSPPKPAAVFPGMSDTAIAIINTYDGYSLGGMSAQDCVVPFWDATGVVKGVCCVCFQHRSLSA